MRYAPTARTATSTAHETVTLIVIISLEWVERQDSLCLNTFITPLLLSQKKYLIHNSASRESDH